MKHAVSVPVLLHLHTPAKLGTITLDTPVIRAVLTRYKHTGRNIETYTIISKAS
jgi:hypothetical protein